MSKRFPIDAELVARADYAYNPRPGKGTMKLTQEQIEQATEYINAVGFVATPKGWQGLADILQYAASTEPGAPLTDAEWEAIESSKSTARIEWALVDRSTIDAVLSRRNVQPQAREFCESCDHGVVAGAVCADCGGTGYESDAPAPVDAGLVRKANDAYFGADIKAADTFPYTGEQMYRMANAVRVIADALLEPVTDEEWCRHARPTWNNSAATTVMHREDIDAMLRARLLAPAKPDGGWVKYADHLAQVQRLQQRVAPLEAEINTLHANNEGASAEVGKLREQVRVLRDALIVTQREFCNWVCETKPEHTEECEQALAALAATEPRP